MVHKGIFNTDSFIEARDKFKTFDSAGGIILARNLEHISGEVFEQKFVGLTFLNQGVQVNNEGGYADFITKLKIGVSGGFALTGGGDNTNGVISLVGASDSIPCLNKDAKSQWNELEIKKAEAQGINLMSNYFRAHNELYQREIDTIAYIGQSGKSTGLLNYAGFASGGATGAFSGLTAQQMYDEVATLITTQWAGVYNEPTFMANRVVMPLDTYNRLTRTILNTAAGSSTVLKALADNFPNVEFGITNNAASVSGSSRMVAFSNNRQAMQLRIPVPLQMSDVYKNGFKYGFESLFGIAGLDVIENGAGRILTGV